MRARASGTSTTACRRAAAYPKRRSAPGPIPGVARARTLVVRKDVITVSVQRPARSGREGDERERGPGEARRAGRRIVLLGVAGLLIAAAALAIGILLFGDFGSTEGRILGTTAVLGLYGLLALPAAILGDRRQAAILVAVVVVLVAAGATLAIALIWTDDPSERLGRLFGTSAAWLAAAVLPAALTLRRRESDARAVQRLFAASSALAVVLAVLFTVLQWADDASDRLGRVFGALLVLESLLVALQPVLARARRAARVYRLRVRVAAGSGPDMEIEAPDLAGAAARAIRAVERGGQDVLGLDVVDRTPDDRAA